jgi:pyruvate carboxylase
MNVIEFLTQIDLKNINEFKINGRSTSLSYIRSILPNEQIEIVEISTEYKPMTTKDIHTIIVSDNADDVLQYINTETHLPNSPSYISITINIKIKERR